MSKCVLCGRKFESIFYAIRDMIPTETAFQWWWRHICGFLTMGFSRRKHATILPVCVKCVLRIKAKKSL